MPPVTLSATTRTTCLWTAGSWWQPPRWPRSPPGPSARPGVRWPLGDPMPALLDVDASAAMEVPIAVVVAALSPLGWGKLTASGADMVNA